MSSTGAVEIACDESGSEGEKLVGGVTDVFAHAGVRLDIESAAACVSELRRRIRSPAEEYKAGHLLRSKHRAVLIWLLGPSGPILGNARVHLVDKTFLLLVKITDLVADGGTRAAALGLYLDRPARERAGTLYREGPRAVGPERWQAFLEASNDLMRTRNRWGVGISVEAFFGLVDEMRADLPPGPVADTVALLAQARPQVDELRSRLLDDPGMIPILDPLVPAIIRAVSYWSEGGRPVSIVHDRHSLLTPERIAQLKQVLGESRPAVLRRPVHGRLADLRLVESSSDPRVQVADFLAGVARKIASDQLNGRPDGELLELLRPYLDLFSILADAEADRLVGGVLH